MCEASGKLAIRAVYIDLDDVNPALRKVDRLILALYPTTTRCIMKHTRILHSVCDYLHMSKCRHMQVYMQTTVRTYASMCMCV